MARREPDGAAELFIDLGELPPDEPDDDDRLPLPPRGSRPWHRRLAAALAVGAVLGGVTAAVPDPRPRLSALAFLDGEGTQVQVLDDELVLVLGPQGATAYETAGWRMRWEASLSQPVHAFAMGEVVLLRSGGGEDGRFLGWPSGETIAVDRATGRTLWRSLRHVEPLDGLLVSYSVDGDQPDLEVRDPRSYDLRWRLPAARTWVGDVRRDALWRLSPDGELFEHDLVTGAVRRSARLRLPAAKYINLVVSREGIGFEGWEDNGRAADRPVLWYDIADLRQVSGARQWAWETDCGGGLSCAYPAGDGRSFLIDPATGAPIRSLPEGGFVPSPAGLLLVDSPGLGFVTPKVLARVDPATGMHDTGLRDWHVLNNDGAMALVLGRAGERKGTTYLAALAADGPHRLGSVPYQVRGCTPAGDALVCTTMAGDIAVWHVTRERA
ncbi:hypothetical protein [Catellatospora sp. NPDC049609]|uniref:hypothetical protein n=1 Tax=Catellatospora sp. NPDC049609 TaxID=3155505 RepID=UPI003415A984